MERAVNIEDFLEYVQTFSAIKTFEDRNGAAATKKHLEKLAKDLKEALPLVCVCISQRFEEKYFQSFVIIILIVIVLSANFSNTP